MKNRKPLNPHVAKAAKRARAFLAVPHTTMRERASSLESAAMLARQAVDMAVRAGRDDLAFRALELAQDMEA